jgi:Ni/Co efflux regulator RcnB
VIVILTIALTVVWSAGDKQDEDAGDNQDKDAVYSQDENAVDSQDKDPGDNQDEDDDQDHSIGPTHEFIVKKTKWQSGPLLRCMVALFLHYNVSLLLCCKVV